MISKLTLERVGEEPATVRSCPHVLLVVDELRTTLGGGERIALKIAKLLPRYGYRTSILTFSADHESAAVQAAPCPVYLLPLKKTYTLSALRAALELRDFIQHQQIAIVQTFFESSDLWAGLVSRTTNARLIWSRRDMGILRAPKHKIMYRWMAGLPHAVLAVSNQVRQHTIKVDGVDPLRVRTVYNGIDLDGWDRAKLATRKSSRTLVTTVGNVRHVKGHDVFINAAAQLAPQFPDVSFSIAGNILEQDYFAQLQKQVQRMSLYGRFHFVGGVADLRRHLSEADVFVLPSRSEGFSNAIIEAMAASLPVVATDVGGNSEAISVGESGYLVSPDNPDELAAAIAALLADPARARQMGEVGRKIVEQQFTMDAMMRKIISVYQEVQGNVAG